MVADHPYTAASQVPRSQRARRRKRRVRISAAAEKVRREELEKGVGPTIFQTTDYHMLKGCGWDVAKREQRLREPPMRSGRRRNGWHMPGDVSKLVPPQDSAAWLWWISLGDEAQDELYELSAKCVDQSGVSHEDPDPVAQVTDPKQGNGRIVRDGEDPRAWGRLEE